MLWCNQSFRENKRNLEQHETRDHTSAFQATTHAAICIRIICSNSYACILHPMHIFWSDERPHASHVPHSSHMHPQAHCFDVINASVCIHAWASICISPRALVKKHIGKLVVEIHGKKGNICGGGGATRLSEKQRTTGNHTRKSHVDRLENL